MRSSTKVLIIGFGDIGERVARLLVHRYPVAALVRDTDRAAQARAMGVRPILGDLSQPDSLRQLAGMADVLFHFAPPPADGKRDKHTRHLLAALAGKPTRAKRAGMLSQRLPRRVVYISTTGVYGDCAGEWIDETRALRPATARATRRVDAEQVLCRWGRENGVKVAILRAPGIYAADRMPLERLRLGTATLLSQDDVFTNHIHAEDLARAAIAAARCARRGRIFNVVDDTSLRMGDYFDLVADAFKLPRPARISRSAALTSLSPALMSFMSESRRIHNARLKRELRFRFNYPSVNDFLHEFTRCMPGA